MMVLPERWGFLYRCPSAKPARLISPPYLGAWSSGHDWLDLAASVTKFPFFLT